MYVVGSPVHLTASFTDASGALVDPTAVTVTITKPDGTTTSPTASRLSLGDYYYDYTPTMAGIHQFYFAGTGAVVATQLPDIFTVQAATTAALISINDAKLLMNKSFDVHDDDGEVLAFIQSATDIINTECGYTLPTVFTETVPASVDGRGHRVLVVSRTPVLSVASISPVMIGLPTVDISTLQIKNESGVLYLANWYYWFGPQTVTYTAGRSYIPAALQDACKLIVSWLWETQRGGAISTAVSGFGDDTANYNGMPGFPTRALNLMKLSSHTAAPSLA